MSTYRLLCGRSIPENKGGGFVTESELRAFEDQLNDYLGLDFNRLILWDLGKVSEKNL